MDAISQAYLIYLGVKEPTLQINPSLLEQLQTSHIHTFTHDTIDSYFKRPISLDPQKIIQKFLREKRGGLCYELNGAFHYLLQQLGFEANLASSHVYGYGNRTYDLPIDTHAVIIVTIASESYLVDVGFADSCRTPINLNSESHLDISGHYKILKKSSSLYEFYKNLSGIWYLQYSFSLKPQKLEDFHDNLQFVCHSPLHEFSNNLICTKPTPTGHIAMIDVIDQGELKRKLLIKDSEFQQEIPILTFEDLKNLLINTFGMSAHIIQSLANPRSTGVERCSSAVDTVC